MIFSSRFRPRSQLYLNNLNNLLLKPQRPADLVSSLKHSSQDSSQLTVATASPCREAGVPLLKACLRQCLRKDTDSQCKAMDSQLWASNLWATVVTECHNSRCRATDSLSRCKDMECLNSSSSSGACLALSSQSLTASSEHETERDY